MPIPDLGETAFGEVEDEIAGEGVGREEQRNREVLGGGIRSELSGKGNWKVSRLMFWDAMREDMMDAQR